MDELHQAYFSGERALFRGHDLAIYDSIFENGESPLKESRNVTVCRSVFRWKYPLWYSRDIRLEDCSICADGRAGIWYTDQIALHHTLIEAPKTFRRCDGILLDDVTMTNAAETLWQCRNVTMRNVTAKGDYFAMNCTGMEIDGLRLTGNYSFDGARDLTIRNSHLLSKDAFWNSENVTVYDSFISGEYLGWNAHHLTLVGCTIESLQGLCYVDGLVLRDCRLINTTFAFEYSSIDADVSGRIDSVLDPGSGRLHADSIGTLILDGNGSGRETTIECDKIERHADDAGKEFAHV